MLRRDDISVMMEFGTDKNPRAVGKNASRNKFLRHKVLIPVWRYCDVVQNCRAIVRNSYSTCSSLYGAIQVQVSTQLLR
jgi:hypothetical protein